VTFLPFNSFFGSPDGIPPPLPCFLSHTTYYSKSFFFKAKRTFFLFPIDRFLFFPLSIKARLPLSVFYVELFTFVPSPQLLFVTAGLFVPHKHSRCWFDLGIMVPFIFFLAQTLPLLGNTPLDPSSFGFRDKGPSILFSFLFLSYYMYLLGTSCLGNTVPILPFFFRWDLGHLAFPFLIPSPVFQRASTY